MFDCCGRRKDGEIEKGFFSRDIILRLRYHHHHHCYSVCILCAVMRCLLTLYLVESNPTIYPSLLSVNLT